METGSELLYVIYQNSYVNFVDNFDSRLKISISRGTTTVSRKTKRYSLSPQKINFDPDLSENDSICEDRSFTLRRRTIQSNQIVDTSPKIVSVERKRNSKHSLDCIRKSDIKTEDIKINEKQKDVKQDNTMPDIAISSIQQENKIVLKSYVKDKILYFNQIASKSQKPIFMNKNKPKRLSRASSLTKAKTPNRNLNTSNTVPKIRSNDKDSKSSMLVKNNVQIFESNFVRDSHSAASKPSDLPPTSNLVKLRIAEFEKFFYKNVKVTQL